MIAVYKYEQERESAMVAWEVEDGGTVIRVRLTGETDPALHDEPLTLTTSIPAWWPACAIRQDGTEISCSREGAVVRYDAVPGRGDLLLQMKSGCVRP